MSVIALEVYMDGVPCGTLRRTADGNTTFDYLDGYRDDVDPTPLSLSMPLVVRSHRRRAVLAFLEGLLPDSDRALTALGRRFSVSPRNPFALISHVGGDVAGALQIVPAGEAPSDAVGARNRVRPLEDSEVAKLLGRVVDEYESGTPSGALGRFSLAGAQPKIALCRVDDGWGMPEDATPTTHILKPASADRYRRVDVVEQLTLRAAAHLGNDVAASELHRIGDWHVLVSRRYDRARDGERWRRLHQEDLCQALSVPPSKKYQRGDGGPGIADLAGLVRSLPLAGDRQHVGEALYRALVFNTVAGCTDAHAKNYSLLLSGRRVRLAPLYDLVTYAGYWDRESSIAVAMSVGGEYVLQRMSLTALVREGKRFGLGEDIADLIVAETRTGMTAAFESARRELGDHPAVDATIVDQVIDGVARLPLVAR